MPWNKETVPSVFFTELRVLKRQVASLEKAIDRNEDRITKLRKLHQEQIDVLSGKMLLLAELVTPLKLPRLDINTVPLTPKEDAGDPSS